MYRKFPGLGCHNVVVVAYGYHVTTLPCYTIIMGISCCTLTFVTFDALEVWVRGSCLSFSASEVHFLDRILLYEGMSPWQRPGHRAPSTATWAGRHCDPSWACWSQGSRGPLPRSRLKHQIESILTFVNVNIIHLIHSSWDSHSIFQLSNEEDCLFCSGSIIIVCFFRFSSRILSRVVDR